MTTPIQIHAHEFSRLAVELFQAAPEHREVLHAALAETATEMFTTTPETTTDVLALAWMARGLGNTIVPPCGGYVAPDAAAAMYQVLDAVVAGLERVSGDNVSRFEAVPGPDDKIQ